MIPAGSRWAVLRRTALAVAVVAVGASVLIRPGASGAGGVVGPTLPLNDLERMLSLTASQLAEMKTPVLLRGPALTAVPRARCDAASHPLAGMQGRVPAAAIASPRGRLGWTCNTTQVSHFNAPGGFRVWRYTDVHGHVCAFYDTSLTAPLNLVSVAGGPSLGVFVLDMTHPAHPVHTATLTSLGMLAPHESVNLNARRGLLGAEVGNGLTAPGTFDLYSVRRDCRHPVHLSRLPIATGHESGFSPDGRTFWVAGGGGYIYAIDVTDPRHPRKIWSGAYYSHGLNLSADGNTLYQTDPINGNLGLLDVSQIQARDPHPEVHDISRVTWSPVSVPQNTAPFTSHGHHYLLEFDEFAFRFNPVTIADQVGAARIINIDNPRRPRITSNIRLRVNMPRAHKRADHDPFPIPTQVFGNASHYCAIPRQRNPRIVACASLNSGLRIFDISHPAHPREVAYFIAPPKPRHLVGTPGDIAFSMPAFDPARREVWYTDAGSGFYAVRLSPRAWPR